MMLVFLFLFENMHMAFKVNYKEDGVHIPTSYCVHKLYSISKIEFGIKLVQLNPQTSMLLDYRSRSQVKILGSLRVMCVTLQA